MPAIEAIPVTVNAVPLLDAELLVTTILPVVAPLGTKAVIELGLQEVMVELAPLNATVPLDPRLQKPGRFWSRWHRSERLLGTAW